MSFKFSKDYLLENCIVLLRPVKVEDTDDLFKIAEDSELWKYFFFRGNEKKNFITYIHEAIQNRTSNKEYTFTVIDKRINEIAGLTRFFNIDLKLQNTRLGYTWYGKKFQGTGLNKHCKCLLFDFAFETMQIERVGIGVHEENIRSINAVKSVGCVEEGVFRNIFPSINKKGRCNGILLSMLKEEWFSSKKKALQSKLVS